MMKLIISIATRIIPRHYLQHVSHFFLKIFSLFMRGDNFEDPITGIKYRVLLPYGRIKSRSNVLAPDSMSLERHRLLWLYLKRKTNFFNDRLKFLHIAPEYCFIKIFKSMKNLDYTTADLISPWADIKMDVHEIPYEENSFDVVICNHVLEHVDDDLKVMSEFYRILKINGWGIFQVPIDTKLNKTFEDSTIIDPKEREKHYGQSDHVRQYGLDFGKRLKSVGFKVTEDNFINELSADIVKKYALPPGELIYFCEKL